jgi:hypothetical protein
MQPDLTGAEIAMLRSLPRRIAAQPQGGTRNRDHAEVARRRRLQNWGLLSIKAEPGSGVFLVMITEQGVAALKAARPGGAMNGSTRCPR